MKIALVVCSLALAGLVIAIVVTPPPTRSGHRNVRSAGPPASAVGQAGGASSTSTGPTTSSTTAAPPKAATATPAVPGGPAVASLTPASGPPGQQVTLTGTGFISANGTITLLFGGVQAPVSCPTPTQCTATVPALPAGQPTGPVPVTLTTSTGASRPVAFVYT
jgi:hypothetical protein